MVDCHMRELRAYEAGTPRSEHWSYFSRRCRGKVVVGNTPTSPVNGFALATLCRVFADERSWPVVDRHRWDIVSVRSRYP